MRLEDDGHVVTGQGVDPDMVTASARAYINGLNRLHFLRKWAPRWANPRNVRRGGERARDLRSMPSPHTPPNPLRAEKRVLALTLPDYPQLRDWGRRGAGEGSLTLCPPYNTLDWRYKWRKPQTITQKILAAHCGKDLCGARGIDPGQGGYCPGQRHHRAPGHQGLSGGRGQKGL